MGEQDRSKFVVIIALLSNLAIAVSKLVAALITGSSAMLAETAHTFADTGNDLTLLLGLRLPYVPRIRNILSVTARSATSGLL
jgi:divalent metal cation (Fe/Co/Zn/Cd) transporter